MKLFIRVLLLQVCSLLLLCPQVLRGQEKHGGFGIEVNYFHEKVYKHSPKWTAPLPPFSQAVEVHLLHKTWGKKDWHKRRGFPQWGIGLMYTNYGIDSVYGQTFGIYPTIQIPIISGKKLEWTVRLGGGLGYTTRRYEYAPGWDTLNNAIGSHFNNFSSFQTDLRYSINQHWDVQAGLNFTHMSNAASRKPNLGINAYGWHIGARFFPVSSRPEHVPGPAPKLKNRLGANARFGIAMQQGGNADGPVLPVYIFTGQTAWRYRGKNKVFTGADYSYYPRLANMLRNFELFPGREKSQSWSAAVFLGHEWLVGCMGLQMQLGYYLHRCYNVDETFYQKIGGNLYLMQEERKGLREVYISGMLKTHFGQAELAEFGIGFGF